MTNTRLSRLPTEIYVQVFFENVESNNQEISRLTSQPQNGQARENRRLASLLTVNKATYEHLKHLTWQRLSIHHTGINIDHDAVQKTEKLYQDFKLNKQYTRILNLNLSSPTVEDDLESTKVWLKTTTPSKLIQLATSVFQSASANEIQECTICLDLVSAHLKMGDRESLQQEVLWPKVHSLMGIITTFQNLTTFKFLTTEVAHISESYLAWIINQLSSLHTVILCGYNIGHVIEKLKHESDLGQALASRISLKKLDIRYLKSFTIDWLDIEWQCQIQELTVEPIILSTNSFFPEEHLLHFCHIFHQSLIFLNLATRQPRYRQEMMNLAKDFNSLRYLTLQGSHSVINVFSLCPNIESLTWLNGSPRLTEELKGKWARLKTIRIPQDYEQEHPLERDGYCSTSRFQVEIISCTLSLGIKDAWTDLKSWFNYNPAPSAM